MAAVGNFNGDAFSDLAIANASSSNVTILLGNGNGGFSQAAGSPIGAGNASFWVVVSNFDGDAALDLAVTNQNSNDVTILLNSCQLADLGVTVSDTPDPVVPGTNLSYTLTVQNAGPNAATSVSLADPLPAGTTFVSLTAPAGWSCTTPAVGSAGTVTCTIANLPVTSAQFTLVVQVGAGVAAGTIITNAVSVDAATSDVVGGNNSAQTTTTVAAATPTPTLTFTPTATVTVTGTPPATSTATPSPTATPTPSPTVTPTVTPFAASANNSGSGDKKDKDEQAKESEDDKRQRERTNRSGRDEYATEGNVIAVDTAASPPTITIANRDGVVTLVWVGPPDQLPGVGPGDYIQVDGEKIHEQLYEITDLSAD